MKSQRDRTLGGIADDDVARRLLCKGRALDKALDLKLRVADALLYAPRPEGARLDHVADYELRAPVRRQLHRPVERAVAGRCEVCRKQHLLGVLIGLGDSHGSTPFGVHGPINGKAPLPSLIGIK
jgi:hypothetical protein